MLFQLHDCEGESGHKDILFHQGLSFIDEVSAKRTEFDLYRKYSPCPVLCSLLLLYNQNKQELLAYFGQQSMVDVKVECNRGFSKCSINTWNCSNLPEKEYSERILTMIQDMLGGGDAEPKSQKLTKYALLIILLFFTVVVVAVLVTKKLLK